MRAVGLTWLRGKGVQVMGRRESLKVQYSESIQPMKIRSSRFDRSYLINRTN